MYYYIYDQFLSHKKYDKILAQIESKITDLGIKDRILKMSILKSIPELVTDALRKGASTIVIVGNDQTINQVVNLIADRDVLLGIIPIESGKLTDNRYKTENSIANFLGISDPLEACDIISARKVETINLGEINNNYFISSVKVFEHNLQIKCNNKFTITPMSSDCMLGVYNFLPELDIENIDLKSTAPRKVASLPRGKKYFNPQDNFLEVVVEPKDKKALTKIFKSVKKGKQPDSIFRVKKVSVKSTQPEKQGSVLVDNFRILKTPLDIKVSDKKLDIIVGKERKF